MLPDVYSSEPKASKSWLVAIALGVASLCYAWLIVVFKGSPAVVGLAAAPFAAVFFLAKPVQALYLAIGAAIVAELKLLPWLAIQRGVSEISGQSLSWFILSPLEVFILSALVTLILKKMVSKTDPFTLGTFFKPMVPFFLFVGAGVMTGFAANGDMRIALWEVRTLIYIPAVYLVFCNVINTKDQLQTVTWVVLLSIGLDSILGTWSYFAIYHGNLSNVRAMTEHQLAIFINVLYLFVLAFVLYRVPRWQGRVSIALLPVATITYIAANRRAGFIALAIGLVLLLVLAYRDNRRAVAGIAVAGAAIVLLYAGVFWNSSSFLARPLQGIKSVSAQAGTEDYYSNLYRVLEKWDIASTLRRSPLVGVGFGGKFDMPIELIYYDSPFREYITHNSVVWIWLKTGAGGFIAFLAFIGLAFMRAANVFRRFEDRQLKAALAVGLVFIVMDLVYSYVDQGWSPKETVYVGTILGMYAVVERMLQPVGERVTANCSRERHGCGVLSDRRVYGAAGAGSVAS